MGKTMTPSKTTTVGQIDKAVSLYRTLLEKHAREFNAEDVQKVLGQSDFVDAQFAVFRHRVEAICNTFVRTVRVNRTQTAKEALDATGREQYVARFVVNTMPKGEGDDVELVFFKPDMLERNDFISSDDLAKEYKQRRLRPADPFSVIALNEADPTLADEKCHATLWKNVDGDWCYIVFSQFEGVREVAVDLDEAGWTANCWFVGIRK